MLASVANPNHDLSFSGVLQEERHVNCRAAEEENVPVGMDCSVGSLFMSSLDKVRAAFHSQFTAQNKRFHTLSYPPHNTSVCDKSQPFPTYSEPSQMLEHYGHLA